METLATLDSLCYTLAPWFDTLALFLVIVISYKRQSWVAVVVLSDFILTYFTLSFIKTLPIWPNVGTDHQYILSIKDIIVAVTLYALGARPLITLSYLTGAALSSGVWFGYVLVYDYVITYEIWLIMFYVWSPLYLLVMFLEVYALNEGSGSGRGTRRKHLCSRWRALFRRVSASFRPRFAQAVAGNQEP